MSGSLSLADEIQAAVDFGYSAAADVLGQPFSAFRPVSTDNPLAPGNLIATLPAVFSADDYRFGRPQAYAKSVWTVLVDSSQTQPGDYLVEVTARPGQGIRTFFVASQQPLLPIQAVACNAVVSVARPTPQEGIGALPAGGNEVAVDVPTVTVWPCSMLTGTKGEADQNGLPDTTRGGWMIILLPPSLVADIRTDDILTDDRDVRYLVSNVERSALGWKISASFADA